MKRTPTRIFFTKNITDRSVKFIKENKDKPFFLYIPHPIPHRPIHVRDEYLETAKAEVLAELAKEKPGEIDYPARDKLYYQAIHEIDWSVGEILKALKQNGVDDNTIVLFTSDNGQSRVPDALGTAYPLSGGKGTTLEGGLRVPTVIRWPAAISAGSDTDELLTAMDLLPTFTKLAGGIVPADRVIDGKDILSCLTNGAASPHDFFCYYFSRHFKAIRAGQWKLHFKQETEPEKLYNLDEDIGEKINLAKEHPEIVGNLRILANRFEKQMKSNQRKVGLVKK